MCFSPSKKLKNNEKTTKSTEMKWQMKPNGIALQSSEFSETNEERKNPLLLFLWKVLEKSQTRYAWKNKCGLVSLFVTNHCDCCWSKYWYLYLLGNPSKLHYHSWKNKKEKSIIIPQQMWRKSVCIVKVSVK